MFCSTHADMKRYLWVIGVLPAHVDLHNRCLRASLEHFFKSGVQSGQWLGREKWSELFQNSAGNCFSLLQFSQIHPPTPSHKRVTCLDHGVPLSLLRGDKNVTFLSQKQQKEPLSWMQMKNFASCRNTRAQLPSFYVFSTPVFIFLLHQMS